ncbi:response regulator transcription factor [Alloscardovia sp. HMSC034E08]|uniref:response regulator transcription factor n=1 Tax=Alloscardovia sp. HMSC034E08 TaxID=1739413 RepID=UPI0008B478AB|nr:response regulator transcription factor [Alloscardovia sp. HMSC034E08]OFQ96966.1 DNA-binding response regulator [Alloscardovia sp. HMSC034E08]
MTIRILLADDQTMVRDALAALLGLQSDIEVTALCSNGDEVLTSVQNELPDVCLLDIEMPGMDGLSLVELLGRTYPSLPRIIVTAFGRPGYVQRALAAGARGFLVKTAAANDLADAVRKVVDGQIVVDPHLAVAAMAAVANPLTVREQEIMRLVRAGKRDADIAHELFISTGTVRNHISVVLAKTHTVSRMEAALQADEVGWL